MTRVAYPKPALTFQEQLLQLQKRGLHISDEEAFLCLLEKKSYYRFSGYWYHLLADKENYIFKPKASFDDAYQMYKFEKQNIQIFYHLLGLSLRLLFSERFLHSTKI